MPKKSFKLCTLWEIKIDQPITILYHIWYHVILKEKYCIFYVTISQVPIVLCQKSLIFNICVSVCECVHMCVEPTEAGRTHVCLSVSECAHVCGAYRGWSSPCVSVCECTCMWNQQRPEEPTGPPGAWVADAHRPCAVRLLWAPGRELISGGAGTLDHCAPLPGRLVAAFNWSALTSGFCCRQSCISQAIWALKFLKIPWQQLNHGSLRCSWGVVDFF